MGPDHAMHHSKSKACAALPPLGGEEWLEHTADDLGFYATPAVAHRQPCVTPSRFRFAVNQLVRQVGEPAQSFDFGICRGGGLYLDQATTAVERVAPIGDEVCDHLDDLNLVATREQGIL